MYDIILTRVSVVAACITTAGEYFRKAQGRVVMMTPKPSLSLTLHHLEVDHPQAYTQLASLAKQLEHQFKDVQKVTFTIEDGDLFVVQAQSAQRSPKAAARIAVEMVKEGLISKSEAILKMNPTVCTRMYMCEIFYSRHAA
jgi:pyruvate,orthophosphate dikinase